MAMSQGRLADSADERQGNIHQRDRRFKALPCVSDNPPWSRPRMFVRTVICRWFSLRATIVAPFITLISAHRAAERQFDQLLNIIDIQTVSATDGLNRGHYCRRCAARCAAEKRDAPVYVNDLSGRSAGGVEGTSCILHGHQIATGPDTSSVQRDRIEFFGGIYFRGGRDRRGASVSRLLQVGWAR